MMQLKKGREGRIQIRRHTCSPFSILFPFSSKKGIQNGGEIKKNCHPLSMSCHIVCWTITNKSNMAYFSLLSRYFFLVFSLLSRYCLFFSIIVVHYLFSISSRFFGPSQPPIRHGTPSSIRQSFVWKINIHPPPSITVGSEHVLPPSSSILHI